ncbi:peptidoglycan D,D-transpeptidase FtsI family protein [Longirhabdus pacifica]|uniref:peptidoglycan D,D-transpeptidase FtsI family protein n=1 Tax=Longirhabdus pacifica TaxID=2305227 RepID=UPI0010088C08|nr:penicillin-binding protein 2 [Longirhabdus pacifica]
MVAHQRDEQKKKQRKKVNFAFRLNVFFFCIFVLFSILIIRLAILQFVEREEWTALKTEFRTTSVPIPPIRGKILDADGEVVVYSTPTQSLYFQIEPDQKQEDAEALAVELADVFNAYGDDDIIWTAEDIVEKMDLFFRKDLINTPRKLKTDLSDREIAYFTEHRNQYQWIEIVEESTRRYVEENNQFIAPQLIGYMRQYNIAKNNESPLYDLYRDTEKDYLSKEYVGLDGIELMYQEELRGENGNKIFYTDKQHRIVELKEVTAPVKGSDLHLTIDKDVQMAAQTAIKDHLEYVKTTNNAAYSRGREAIAGYAVAMEVKTGKVVAMANYAESPDYEEDIVYDPHVWNDSISQEEYNKIQYLYPNGSIKDVLANYQDDAQRRKHPGSLVPLGSTMKPLTVLVGLNEGLFTPDTQYSDNGKFIYGLDGSNINNSNNRANGLIDPAEALRTSSNTFMAEMIGEKLYNKHGGAEAVQVWDKYMKMFGLGDLTGSGLPNENKGLRGYLNTEASGSNLAALVFASFGQNARYTTLQLAQYTATLANKGTRMQPQFVEKITSFEGEVLEQFEPVILEQNEFPEAYWDEIYEGMSNVAAGGFSTPYNGEPLPSYTVARKTGTSEQAVSGSIIENGVFIAFAPIEDPQLAVAVVVPEGGYGAWASGPIARAIFDAYFIEQGVIPDPNEQTEETQDTVETE